MKILIIVHGFPPRALGGTELYADAQARALCARGDDVIVLTREQDASQPEYAVRTETRAGVQIVWINNTFRNTRSFEEAYRNEAIGAIAERVIDDVQPDVAHIHHLTCLSTTIVRSLADRGIPRFVTLHDYWLLCHRGQLLDRNNELCTVFATRRSSATDDAVACHTCLGSTEGAGLGKMAFTGASVVRALERRLPMASVRQLGQFARRTLSSVASSPADADRHARERLEHMRDVCSQVTHFLAPSDDIRTRFIGFGIDPARISVARLGIDSPITRGAGLQPWLTPCPTHPGPLRLGFLGSLMISKAPHVLLEAMTLLPRGAVSVDVFGDFVPYHGDDSYRTRVAPLLTHEAVRAHGAIPRDRIAEALASIDVLVVPSIWPENSPLVIQEAFQAGVPSVASRIGGMPEMIEDGRNGLLFEAGNAADLARTIERLLHEPGLLDFLRAGIPAVRTIDEDVRLAREMYQTHAGRRTAATPTAPRAPAATGGQTKTLTRIAAIVLNYRTPDDTLLAVQSLAASRRPLDAIIVVDNDGDERSETREALGRIFTDVVYLRTSGNLGFSGGMNVGIREALARGAEAILLTNSDSIVPPDSIARLEDVLRHTPHAGLAGPLVLSRRQPDRITSAGMSYAPVTGRMRHCDADSHLRGRDLGTRTRGDNSVDGLSGCLMLIRREVFDAIGLLDEDYFFSFEDLDFCLRARRAGFTSVLAADAVVYHEGSRSIGPGSSQRLYYAARNHLMMADRIDPSSSRMARSVRAASIVLLNLAHAVRANGGSLTERTGAVVRGTRDYLRGRCGPCPTRR